MRKLAPLALVLAAAAGCGGHQQRAAAPKPQPHRQPSVTRRPSAPTAAAPARCVTQPVRELGSARVAFTAFAPRGAVAYRVPGGSALARFGRENANGYPTYFGVVGKRLGADCRTRWYRVQLPIRPNGVTGWVRAADLRLSPVDLRIEVDLSRRTLTLFRSGRRLLTATVAVGSSATPTPVGRYYVNQRLVPADASGPYGPGAIGISAFSPVLTGWTQGGPVAIHGTNEPWSIGHAVSNGCVRLPNATLARLFRIVPAGTPVIIHP